MPDTPDSLNAGCPHCEAAREPLQHRLRDDAWAAVQERAAVAVEAGRARALALA